MGSQIGKCNMQIEMEEPKLKRKITTLAILIVVLSTMLLLMSCGNGSSKIVGQWVRQNTEGVSAPFDELEFFSDNTYSSDDANYNGNYSIDGGRIKFSGILVEPITCSFDISGKTLTLAYEDETWKFTKAE